MKVIILLLLPTFSLLAQERGKIELVRYVIGKDSLQPPIKMGVNIWYCGKRSIQEVPQFHFETGVGGTKNREPKKCYLLIDRLHNEYSYFANFSDTASLIKSFTGSNPIKEHGGWDLYSNNEFPYDSQRKITDTIMDGVSYSRWRFSKLNEGTETQYILFADCKKKNGEVIYMRPFSKKFGCPVSRMEIFSEGRLKAVSEFKLISDVLTADELKVFRAWGKRSIKH